MTTPTRDQLYSALGALDRARGQIEAALRIKDPAPEVVLRYWMRAAGEMRALQCHERRGTSEEARYGHE